MDDHSLRFTNDLSGWVNLLVTHEVWYSTSLGVCIKLLHDSSGIDIVDDPDGFLLGSELGFPLGDLLDSDTWPLVGLQLIVDIPPGLKVIFPDLVGSTSWATLAFPFSGSCSKFLPHTSGKCPNSPSQDPIYVSLSIAKPTLPRRSGCSWNCHEDKGNNKIESKSEGLVTLGVFVVSKLTCNLVLNILVNPPYSNDAAVQPPNFSFSVSWIIIYFCEAPAPAPEEA